MRSHKIPLPSTDIRSRIRQYLDSHNPGRMQAKQDGNVTNIDLYGEIGFFGVNASDFRQVLKNAGDINLRINSPGGDVFDGIAIYNDLLDHKGKVIVTVSGLAASAASIVAMAGDEIRIAESAFVMIHNAWGMVVGNRHDMRDMAEVLDGIDKALARIYANRTSVGIRTITQMMDDETWINGKDAVEQGFADQLSSQESDAKASWNLGAFQHAPKELANSQSDETGKAFTIREFERICREAGATQRQAKDYAARLRSHNHRDDGRESNSTQRDADRTFEQWAIEEVQEWKFLHEQHQAREEARLWMNLKN